MKKRNQKFCDACGKVLKGGIFWGNARLCRSCHVDISMVVEDLHSKGKPVDVLRIAKQIFRENNCAGQYVLQDIPEELWNRAREHATDEGKSMREFILASMEEYLSD